MGLRFLTLVFLTTGLIGCGNSESKPEKSEPTKEPTKKEVKTDAHGCVPDKGEAWSIMRNACLSLQEEALMLRVDDGSPNPNLMAFLLFDALDSSNAELFVPHDAKSFLLPRVQNSMVWKDEHFEVQASADGLLVLKDGIPTYKQ